MNINRKGSKFTIDVDLVAMLSEPKWLFKVMLESEILFISIDGDSQSLETWLLRFIEFILGLRFSDVTTIVYTIYIM